MHCSSRRYERIRNISNISKYNNFRGLRPLDHHQCFEINSIQIEYISLTFICSLSSSLRENKEYIKLWQLPVLRPRSTLGHLYLHYRALRYILDKCQGVRNPSQITVYSCNYKSSCRFCHVSKRCSAGQWKSVSKYINNTLQKWWMYDTGSMTWKYCHNLEFLSKMKIFIN